MPKLSDTHQSTQSRSAGSEDFFLRVPTEDLFHMKPVNDNEKEVEDEGRRRRKMEKRGFFP